MTDGDTAMPQADDDRPTTVLEVFGMKLAVKNRRLAEVLTMDAAEALGLDVLSPKRQAAGADTPDAEGSPTGAPGTAVPTDASTEPTDTAAARQRAEAAGRALGFETLPSGTWRSSDGPLVHVRVVAVEAEEPAPSELVRKIAELVPSGRGGRGESVLLVIADRASAQPCARAVVRQQLAGDVRVVSLEALDHLVRVLEDAPDTHQRALWVLVPARSVDAGSVLGFMGDG